MCVRHGARMQVVCAIIENACGEVLLCQRGAGRKLAGLWEFPGGKIEEGETAPQALIREIHEELGIDVEVQRGLTPVNWAYDELTICLIPFVCKILQGEPQALEHAQLRWCQRHEFAEIDWAPADVPVWQEYLLRLAS